jgi:hypothetical protein
MLTAMVAGIAGAWSPCGFSMLDTIGSALGNPRRSATYVACTTFTLGAVVGGALTFGALASVGHIIGRDSSAMREAFGVGIALAAAIADWRGVKIAPQIRRQVPERWRWSMPLPLACGLYGILLGLGFTTFVLAFAVWALAGISFATGSPTVGLLIGCAFGVGRALPIVWMAPGLRNTNGLRPLEEMAAEPRLWLGLRRLDALGLCLCALFLSGTVATAAGLPASSDPSTTAAGVPSSTDPSAAAGELVWQPARGPGMVRLRSGRTNMLPGSHPALGESSIAWQGVGVLTIADRSSMAVKTTLAVAQLSALAVSDRWALYRAPGAGGGESLVVISLQGPTQSPRSILSRQIGVIGRPTLDGSTAVFTLDTPHSAMIEAVNLASGALRTLRSTNAGATLANPSLLRGRLLYERIDRCSQQLRIGSPNTQRHDRVLLRLPSTVRRDPGYQVGYEHHYNGASLCHNRDARQGGSTRLGATALAASKAYVTEIPRNTAEAYIMTVSRGGLTARRSAKPPSAPAKRARPARRPYTSASAAGPVPAPAVALAPHTPKPTAAKAWQPGVREAIAYAHTRAGEVSFAVRTAHRLWGWRPARTVPSASVLKAMLLVAYLDDPRVRNRALSASDHRLIDPMIQHSNNAAATQVLAFVGAAGVYGVAQRAGMRNFSLDPVIWGLSRIDAIDQARFFLHIDSHVVPRHRATAMHLLATVTPSQRWGIGQLRLPGWHLYFKGGWGSGSGAVEHQIALLRHGATRVSVAVLITNSPSHAYAKRTLRGVFAALLRHVHSLLAPPATVARPA